MKNHSGLLIFVLSMLFMHGCSPSVSKIQSSPGRTQYDLSGGAAVDAIDWSPIDPDLVLITSGGLGFGESSVQVVRLSTGEIRLIAETSYGDFLAPHWAPDGNSILVVVREGTLGYQTGGLWKFDLVQETPLFLLNSGPSRYSIDYQQLASFVLQNQKAQEPFELQLIDFRSGVAAKIYQGKDDELPLGLARAPDNYRLAFAIGRGNPGISFSSILYIAYTEDDDIRIELVLEDAKDPAWSPIGDRIAYVSVDPGSLNSTGLKILDLSANCHYVIPDTEEIWSPTWSPDGNSIAMVTPTGFQTIDIHQEGLLDCEK